MKRRTFLAAAGALAVSPVDAALPGTVIDTHTHFYDPTRPEGISWPPKDNELLYRTVLPDDFRKLALPLGVTGTIVIEAVARLEDNQWMLDLAARHPVITAVVGRLQPGTPDFRKHLDRFRKNPLFAGLRLGGSGLNDVINSPDAMSDMKALSATGLELDLNGGASMLPPLMKLIDRIPDLRIVIDHLPFDMPADHTQRSEHEKMLRGLHGRPQVYAKVSNVLRRRGHSVPDNAASYREPLDKLWDIFGPDRVIYGSNWPVSDRVAPYDRVFKVVKEYFTAKGAEASEKYFWKNSKAAYRWPDR